jgi:hypothetical protein
MLIYEDAQKYSVKLKEIQARTKELISSTHH